MINECKFELYHDQWDEIEYVGRGINIKCKCKYCGNIRISSKLYLETGRMRCDSCKDIYLKSLIGKKINRLTILKVLEERSSQGHILIYCECECGNMVTVPLSSLRNEHTRSCGCLHKEGNRYTHRLSNTRIYSIFNDMKKRCYNPNSKSYNDYGAKGIFICDEWLNDFMAFYNWSMENGYNDTLTIDRINVYDGYKPDNCRWITRAEQMYNKTNTVYVDLFGRPCTIKQVMELYPASYNEIQYRHYINDLNNFLYNKFGLIKIMHKIE